jgi:hypothetical protein
MYAPALVVVTMFESESEVVTMFESESEKF